MDSSGESVRDSPDQLPTNHDTAASAITRFAAELVAWVAGPWAVRKRTGSWVAAIAALVVLVGTPAVFNAPGDKNLTLVTIPGPVRVVIEAVVIAAAVGGAWVVWPVWAFVLVVALSISVFGTGVRRYRWLLAGSEGGAYYDDVADPEENEKASKTTHSRSIDRWGICAAFLLRNRRAFVGNRTYSRHVSATFHIVRVVG